MLTCPKCVSDCFIYKTSNSYRYLSVFHMLNHMQKYEKIRYDLTDSNFFFTLALQFKTVSMTNKYMSCQRYNVYT